jgi:DnaJ like chaperone protein
MLYQMFLQVQIAAVAADGKVDDSEREILVRIARRLGLSERDVAQLEALLRAATTGAAGGGASMPPSYDRVNNAYAALGVSPDISDDDLKRAYRKLIVENHPDKLAAKGLPENMRQLAEQRARDINAAYDVIKKARDLS